MPETIFVCMVELCKWNNGEGGCIVPWGHVDITLKDSKAVCDCFETKDTYHGIAENQ